ncbi:hypothetical protein A3A05_02025 [Candidatus Nomurabacteria bacterium RIFCSPLOWO2_01_FULL_41_12]|uniref:Fe2OG dioxygenase domain-containing protein n=1 Tax=Candidatus Nomurabacteria bacterium RIFCSPLOWO2_01_FULL_41_12 TaxID=1801774 RepID=A0A1F6WVF5_9BACT|nr:MAG: hypothetical protein A3A05_02025 [Candidatus Nomurabacteria bacterium RIFCSPLOWO2_01_FULL_41_12]
MNKQNIDKDFLSVLGDKYDKDFFTDKNGSLRQELDKTGVLVLPDFVSASTLKALQEEADILKKNAYKSESVYNLYVLPDDKSLSPDAPRNRKFRTTKGCVPDDQIPKKSILRKIYEADIFRGFMCKMQRLINIYSYSDNLSSININYYDPDDSLEWHFDNADFAVTLLVKNPKKGGIYEYFPNMRYGAESKEDYETLRKILDRKLKPKRVLMGEGTLMIFRGNRSLHRVTKVEVGERVLITLNYNIKPRIPLSEKSRMTFFGRTK